MASFLSPKICISRFLTLPSSRRMHHVPTLIREPAIRSLNLMIKADLTIGIKPDLVYHAHVIQQQYQR